MKNMKKQKEKVFFHKKKTENRHEHVPKTASPRQQKLRFITDGRRRQNNHQNPPRQ